MGKRLILCVLSLALVGTSCSKSTTSSSTPPTTNTSGGANYTVQVDAKKAGNPINVAFEAYFPGELSVHPGDSVTFQNNFSGEPHSVTFGTLVDQGLPLVHGPGKEPAALAKIPPMLPNGPGDANPVTVNPCFIASGALAASACGAAQPDFTGTYELYSSGYLDQGKSFSMTVSKNTKPGTYLWFCALHRGAMQGRLTVVSASGSVQTPGAVKQQGDALITAAISKLQGPEAHIQKPSGPGMIVAGISGPPQQAPNTTGFVAEFGPKNLTAKVGQQVKWNIVGPHTITFVPESMMAATQGAIVKAPDGKFHANKAAFFPVPGKAPFNAAKPTGNVDNAGTWNGVGELNSGILLGFGPPGFLTFELKFSKKGTFKYHCAVHPDMEGSVTVA